MYLSINGPSGSLMCYVRCSTGADDQSQPQCPKTHMLTCIITLSLCVSLWHHDRHSNGTTGSSSSACTRMGRHLGCWNALEEITLTLLPWGGSLRDTWRHVTWRFGNNKAESMSSQWELHRWIHLNSSPVWRHVKPCQTISIALMWIQYYTLWQRRVRRMWISCRFDERKLWCSLLSALLGRRWELFLI